MPAYVDTMAYVGEIPWHRLGTYLGEENVDGKTMQLAAGLDWTAEKVPVFFDRAPLHAESGPQFVPVEGEFTIVRSDTGDSLNVTVGSRYELFQNQALFEFGEALRREGDVRWHTAGSLHGGRKIWALAQIAGEIGIRRRNGSSDVSAPFLLLYNSHDGKSHFIARDVITRVVCWNTLSAALREGDSAEFRGRHTASLGARAKEAAEVLGLAAENFEHSSEVLQGFADEPFDRVAFTTFAAQILTGKDEKEEALEVVAKSKGRSKSILDRKGNELVNLFENGLGNFGDDKKSALDAVTEFIDHQKARVKSWKALDDRAVGKGLDSAAFGTGERTKKRAVRLLTRW